MSERWENQWFVLSNRLNVIIIKSSKKHKQKHHRMNSSMHAVSPSRAGITNAHSSRSASAVAVPFLTPPSAKVPKPAPCHKKFVPPSVHSRSRRRARAFAQCCRDELGRATQDFEISFLFPGQERSSRILECRKRGRRWCKDVPTRLKYMYSR